MTHRKDEDAGNQPAKRTAISTLTLGREMPRARKPTGQGCAAANTAPGAQANPRRAPGRTGPLLALVLGALACLTASAPALAATLVGNSPLAKNASADEHVQVLTSGWLAQPFSTGSNSGGYSVSNVKVGSYSGARFSVEICETTNALTYNDRGKQNPDIRGFPVTSTCKAFSTPGYASKGQEWRIENYTPSSTLTLGADKHYLVLMKLNDNRVIQVHPNGQHPFEWENFTIQGHTLALAVGHNGVDHLELLRRHDVRHVELGETQVRPVQGREPRPAHSDRGRRGVDAKRGADHRRLAGAERSGHRRLDAEREHRGHD